MPTLNIDVTAEDIQQGFQGNAADCPVARACRRAVGHRVAIFRDILCLTPGTEPVGPHRHVQLPEPVLPWIERYDKGQLVEPFRFDVTIP